MGAEEVYNLLRVSVFLGAQKAVVENPVVGFVVFGSKNITAESSLSGFFLCRGGDMDIVVQGEVGGEVTQHGLILRELDKIIYPVCKFCRNCERSGFIEGIRIGVLLQTELTAE